MRSRIQNMARALPAPVHRSIHVGLQYVRRVSRWPVILVQIRGATAGDRRTLLRSALWAPRVAARDPLRWQDPILLDDATVDVVGVGRFELRARCDDLWHVLPWREQAIFDYLRATLGPGDTFIDAGANLGIYTVLASRQVGPGGRVIAVEMMEATARRLERNVRLNGLTNVTVDRRALHEVGGMPLRPLVKAGHWGQARLPLEAEQGGGGPDEVITATLDEVARGAGPIQVLKLDLEGAEACALRGAEDVLSRTQSVVYERWGTADERDDAVGDLLRSRGFRITRLDGNNCLAQKVV